MLDSFAEMRAVATVETLRKTINGLPAPTRKSYQGRPLKDNGEYKNPCRFKLQGYELLACQFADKAVLIQIIDPVALQESGSGTMTLEQLGAPSYKKLLSCMARGVVYRKDGTLCVAIMRGDGEPVGAALLPPMTEKERVLMIASFDLSN